MNKKLPLLALLGLVSFSGFSQVADSTGATMADLSLEELMNVQVVSASKKSESAFEAPLSIGSVSKDEIQKAGSTSIVEALRLIPGILVTEVTNGNYQVDIRGFNNTPPGTAMHNASNSISLVMIDNRPVYNYFNGGTFWETLPIDLNDVERIEVVRGASAALYGPNAAAGVINIITRKAEKDGLYAVANTQGGSPTTYIGNASVGYKFGKFDFIVSGNYQDRKRTENDYFSWGTNSKVPIESLTSYATGPLVDVHNNPNAAVRYPNPKLALKKFGYNAFLNYAISEKSNVGVAFGGQQSQAQKVTIENLTTSLSNTESSSNYVDARGKFNNLNTMVAYQLGTQNVATGSNGYKYDFNTIDATAEYDIHVKENLTFRPGLNFRNATYDDSKYADVRNSEGFINGKKSLSNMAMSIRGEYNLKKFKMIAAFRADKYNHPDKIYTSYQITPSYKISDKHFLRANYSESFRGPNMYDFYNSSLIFIGDHPVAKLPQYAQVIGNDNLKLLRIDQFEIGYRGKITDNFHIDVDLFHQIAQNFTYLVSQTTKPTSKGIIIPQTAENISMKAVQNGVTVSANYVLNKFQFKPFITVQSTKLFDVPKYRNSPNDTTRSKTNNIHLTYDSTHTGTPSVTGGAYVNYQISKKFNANVTVYYFGNYQYNNIKTMIPSASHQEYGFVNIPSKFLVNARISYKPIEKLDLFVNVRNALNQKSFEFAQTDKTTLMFLVGANFKY